MTDKNINPDAAAIFAFGSTKLASIDFEDKEDDFGMNVLDYQKIKILMTADRRRRAGH